MFATKQVIECVFGFIETEMLPAQDGGRLVLGAITLNLAKSRAEKLVEPLMSGKWLSALGVVGETGGIDIDAVYDVMDRDGNPVTVGCLRRREQLTLKYISVGTPRFVLVSKPHPQCIKTPEVAAAATTGT